MSKDQESDNFRKEGCAIAELLKGQQATENYAGVTSKALETCFNNSISRLWKNSITPKVLWRICS